MRAQIRNLITDIIPHDELEQEHKNDILEWIDSGAPLYRVTKPDNPSKHLVTYFAIFDDSEQSLLLVDHKLAGKWLLTGGHVDEGEHPNDAAVREAREELNLAARFNEVTGDTPLFITKTDVINADGTGAHTDITLWYVMKASKSGTFEYGEDEFSTLNWLTLEEALDIDITLLDPHMHRFIHKLKGALSE